MSVRPHTPLTHRWIALIWTTVLVAGCGDLGPGLDAYRDGRFTDAHTEFAAVVEAEGDDASATLHYDTALAALRAARLGDSEAAAKRAADADPSFVARRDFILGNAAFARCELAALQATGPEAEPFAFDVAIRFAESAADHWSAAAAGDDDWPAARRNVERALLMVQDLIQKKAAAGDKPATKEASGDPRLTPKPGAGDTPPDDGKPETADGDAPGDESEPTDNGEPVAQELPRDRVLLLLDALKAKESEKIAIRRKQRSVQPPEVTEDW